MKLKAIYTILGCMAMGMTLSAAAQVNIGVWSGGARQGTVNMIAQPGGKFHTASVEIPANGSFTLHGADEEQIIAPLGNKEFVMPFNESYTAPVQVGSIAGAVQRPVASTWSGSIDALDLWTDKARYNPGDGVVITVDKYQDFPGAVVRYRQGIRVLSEHPLGEKSWTWQPPATDFTGYLVEVYRPGDAGDEILASIAVDVSSDWKRFARYGYTAWYEPGKEQWIPGDVAFLNRRHINAVQFQDWHWRHHRPYNPADEYTDIANRPISASVIREFIKHQHYYNMKSIFYNLGFGALPGDGAAEDGVDDCWYYYRDRNHSQKDLHELAHMGWKSDIAFVNPANTGWQNYLNDRNQEVYDHFDFDGFQVDQVGFRSNDLYDWDGNRMSLCAGYTSLLQAFKKRHPGKTLIMNSVSKYGAEEIVKSGVVDVCYNEMWASEPSFMDLYWVIFDNNNYAKAAGYDSGKIHTVFAAYMNYDYGRNNAGKKFNTPGVLLTDACIFALGGSHLELGTGQNMLCNEYFPNTNLGYDSALMEGITRYYDFATAYENFLYDTKRELTPTVSCSSGQQLSVWNYQLGPQPRRIVVHGKETDRGQMVYHLLNFTGTNSLSWRDVNGDMPEPTEQKEITITIDMDRPVSKAWIATPDSHACAPREVAYTQHGRNVTLTIPSLKYWTMLVLE